jgi:hypothetical protein
MTGQIKRPLGSLTLVTTIVMSFVGVTVPAHTTRAGDCIAAPNSPSPPGKHWYYRLDWATKRKCWYVGPLGRSGPEAGPSAIKGRATHLHPLPARPNQRLQADGPPVSVSPGEAGPHLPPVKVIAVEPNAASVSETADEAMSSIPEISAPQASTFSETVTTGDAPASSAAPMNSATIDDTAVPQANTLSVNSAPAVARESVAVSTDSQVDKVSDDVEPNVRAGELTDTARLPMISFLYLALGLAAVGILPFAFRKLFKNETNRTLAGADLTEVAASMALRLGRSHDSNGESSDLQQAEAFVLNEAGCARDIEEPNEGTAPTPISHDQPRAKMTFNEYRQRVEACLNWAQEAPAERVVCLTLAEAWLRAALADLADTERNNIIEQGLALPA